MSFQGASPLLLGSVSNVTGTRGPNDPEVGTKATVGGIEYRYVYNSGGEQISVGLGCVPDSAATGYSVTVSAATSADLVVGIVKHATLTTGTYGWVVTKGITKVVMGTDNSQAVRGLIEIAANGVFAAVSNTTGNKAPAVGVIVSAIASGGSGNAFVNCAG